MAFGNGVGISYGRDKARHPNVQDRLPTQRSGSTTVVQRSAVDVGSYVGTLNCVPSPWAYKKTMTAFSKQILRLYGGSDSS